AVFAPVRGGAAAPGGTFYQVFVGKGTVFEGPQGVRVTDITDGTSATALIAEAGQAVPWTKPADLPYDPARPLPKLGGLFPGGFPVPWAAGAVRFVRGDFQEAVMRLVITGEDGQLVDLEKLDR